MASAGLPTPDYFVAYTENIPPCPLRWPVIVKPALQDSSVGLDMNSVVQDQDALESRIAHLLEQVTGLRCLVEQFIRGREFNVGLIESPELCVLPISEIKFTGKGRDFWPIVTYDAKWKPGTSDYELTPPVYPAIVEPELARKSRRPGNRRSFRRPWLPGLCPRRFPRAAPAASLYILEVNPNPDFSSRIAGLSGGLGSAGLTHAEFTVQLIHNALARRGELAKA